MTFQVLREIGIEHHGASKSVDIFRGQGFDLVVTVCDDANEECPVWMGRGKRLHESFIDPAGAHGTDAERLAIFHRVRDQICEKLPQILS